MNFRLPKLFACLFAVAPFLTDFSRAEDAGETGGPPFKIAGDARRPVSEIFLENITVQKAHGAAKSFANVEGVHETSVRIGELIAETAGGR